MAPIGAVHITPRQAFPQIQGSKLSDRHPGSHARSVLRRFDQEAAFEESPDVTLQLLHQEALNSGEPALIFALAELNHLVAERLRRSVTPWERRDPRDYDLAAVCYAYLYLFGDATHTPDAFDDRFRAACDLYNISLDWALTARRSTNSQAILLGGTRRLPFSHQAGEARGEGQIEIDFIQTGFPWPLRDFNQFLLADHFLIRGMTVRNRQRGLGAPLIAVSIPETEAQLSRALPATVFLRLEGGLAELSQGRAHALLELYSGFGETTIQAGGRTIPLETDTSVQMAYVLNQQTFWQLGRLQFLSGHERVPTGIYLAQPYEAGRIPVVFVHGTVSSPVWWVEMINTLRADPLLRQRCQFWSFVYNSGNPVPFSAVKLREALATKIGQIDPQSKDPALQQMVLIGHSQGGLLAKLAVTDTGDALWRSLSTNRLEDMSIPEQDQALIRRYLFLQRLPFVQRVVFMATPHRGSYLAGNFVRRTTSKLVSLPRTLVKEGATLLTLVEKVNLPPELRGRLPTSVDSMSPNNPILLSLASLSPAPGVKSHSIIAVKGTGPPAHGGDGVVKYASAHVDYADSEFIVRSGHSCQGKPAAIEEVRRILHEHLKEAKPTEN